MNIKIVWKSALTMEQDIDLKSLKEKWKINNPIEHEGNIVKSNIEAHKEEV